MQAFRLVVLAALPLAAHGGALQDWWTKLWPSTTVHDSGCSFKWSAFGCTPASDCKLKFRPRFGTLGPCLKRGAEEAKPAKAAKPAPAKAAEPAKPKPVEPEPAAAEPEPEEPAAAEEAEPEAAAEETEAKEEV